MISLILRNTSTHLLSVNDLGIQISPNDDTDLASNFSDDDLLESTDLQSIYSNGGQILLGGTTSLTYLQLIDYLTALNRYDTLDYNYISGKDAATDITGIELEQLTNGSDTSLHIHDTRYPTKTALATAGAAAVDWANITNKPASDIFNGDTYFYDATRSKWLSISEIMYNWTENNAQGKYVCIGNTQGTVGYLIPQLFTITKIAFFSSSAPANKVVQIRKNNASTPLYSFTLVNNKFSAVNLNIDLAVNDLLQVMIPSTGGNVSDIVCNVYGKWRKP
jgi:hypothetical protein